MEYYRLQTDRGYTMKRRSSAGIRPYDYGRFGRADSGRHPAMHSIGIAVMLGVGAAIPAATMVTPAFSDGYKHTG